MILIHELGHFCAALAVGIKVEVFSIGLGPRLFGFRRGETDFRISAIPFGGYVRMLGQDPMQDPAEQKAIADPRSFQTKPRWQRAFVVIAGPLMNVVLAIAIVTGLYMYAFPKQVDSTNPVISNIVAGSPAAQAGLEPGDRIIEIEGQKNPTWQDVLTREAFSANHPLHALIVHKGQQESIVVTPRMDPKEGIGVAGWMGDPDVEVVEVVKGSPAAAADLKLGDLLISVNHQPVASTATTQEVVAKSGGKPVEVVFLRGGRILKVSITPKPTGDSKVPWHIGVALKPRGEIVKLPFGPAFVESVRFNVRNASMIFEALRSIIEQRVSPKTLEGPIGIARMSGEAAQEGPPSFLFLMAIVSLNLAIVNLLPIPILDGGTLLMLAVEMLIQRDMSLQLKETVFKLGFVFLMMVVVFVIYNDISKIFVNG
jgi:regulator of sigma E protease